MGFSRIYRMNLQKNISDPKVWIREVTFSDGRKVDLKSDDIVVLVGPNNSGKTVALKNIEQKAIDKASSTVVVVTLELSLSGDENACQNLGVVGFDSCTSSIVVFFGRIVVFV